MPLGSKLTMLWLLTAVSGEAGWSPVEEDLDQACPCDPCASLPEEDAVQVSSCLPEEMASACCMLLARSKLIDAPLGSMLLWADCIPGCTEPMLLGRYTTPSGSMPLLTDSMPLLTDSMPLWLGIMAVSAGRNVPLECSTPFMGSTPLWALSSGGG